MSSYTLTDLLHSKMYSDLRDAFLILCDYIGHTGEDGIHNRFDPAPDMVALAGESVLHNHGIFLEVGRIKNINKKTIVERAMEELGMKCLRLAPEGDPMLDVTLAIATANMNLQIC